MRWDGVKAAGSVGERSRRAVKPDVPLRPAAFGADDATAGPNAADASCAGAADGASAAPAAPGASAAAGIAAISAAIAAIAGKRNRPTAQT